MSKKKDIDELREKTGTELETTERDLRKEIEDNRVKMYLGGGDGKGIKALRKRLAQLLTVKSEMRRQSEEK